MTASFLYSNLLNPESRILNPVSFMPKKPEHPDKQLFDYLSGALDAQSSRMVEDHLSKCADCASVADLMRALKIKAGVLIKDRAARPQESASLESQASSLKAEISETHPDVSELASLFYGRAPRTRKSSAAAHVAACQSCTAEIAEYARAERAASEYVTSRMASGEVPAAAWEMIREWEESSFAKPRPASEATGEEMLTKLSKLLDKKKERSRAMARKIQGSDRKKNR